MTQSLPELYSRDYNDNNWQQQVQQQIYLDGFLSPDWLEKQITQKFGKIYLYAMKFYNFTLAILAGYTWLKIIRYFWTIIVMKWHLRQFGVMSPFCLHILFGTYHHQGTINSLKKHASDKKKKAKYNSSDESNDDGNYNKVYTRKYQRRRSRRSHSLDSRRPQKYRDQNYTGQSNYTEKTSNYYGTETEYEYGRIEQEDKNNFPQLKEDVKEVKTNIEKRTQQEDNPKSSYVTMTQNNTQVQTNTPPKAKKKLFESKNNTNTETDKNVFRLLSLHRRDFPSPIKKNDQKVKGCIKSKEIDSTAPSQTIGQRIPPSGACNPHITNNPFPQYPNNSMLPNPQHPIYTTPTPNYTQPPQPTYNPIGHPYTFEPYPTLPTPQPLYHHQQPPFPLQQYPTQQFHPPNNPITQSTQPQQTTEIEINNTVDSQSTLDTTASLNTTQDTNRNASEESNTTNQNINDTNDSDRMFSSTPKQNRKHNTPATTDNTSSKDTTTDTNKTPQTPKNTEVSKSITPSTTTSGTVEINNKNIKNKEQNKELSKNMNE